jgi:hypothetical protein
LIFGLLLNFITFFKLSDNRLLFSIIVLLDKVIPYYLIRDTKITMRDICFTLIMLTIYVIFLKYNNIDPIKHYTTDIIDRANKAQSPGIKFLRTSLDTNYFLKK